MTEQERAWERRLAREGLAPLDAGDLIRNDGSGKLPTVVEAANRAAMEHELAWRRDRLRAGGFSRADREVWTLYAQGVGYQSIARRLQAKRPKQEWRRVTEFGVLRAIETGIGKGGKGASLRKRFFSVESRVIVGLMRGLLR